MGPQIGISEQTANKATQCQTQNSALRADQNSRSSPQEAEPGIFGVQERLNEEILKNKEILQSVQELEAKLSAKEEQNLLMAKDLVSASKSSSALLDDNTSLRAQFENLTMNMQNLEEDRKNERTSLSN